MRATLLIVALGSSAHAGPLVPGLVPPARDTLVLLPRWDIWRERPAGNAFGLGAAYMFGGFPPPQLLMSGVGVDVRALTGDEHDFGATAVTGHVRATMGLMPLVSFELDAGAVVASDDSGAIAGAGIYLSWLIVELGYTYQRPFGLDDHPWLGRHMATIRGVIPVFSR